MHNITPKKSSVSCQVGMHLEFQILEGDMSFKQLFEGSDGESTYIECTRAHSCSAS